MNLSEGELRTMDAMTKATGYYLKVYPPIWCILSIGNVVSLVVFLQKDMRRVHSNVYLSFLAVVDTVFVNTPAWAGIHELAQGGPTASNMKYWARGKLWEYFLQSSAILSGWLLVVISVDRFVMVFFPLWSKSRLTPRKAFIFTSLTSLPFVIYPMHNLIGRDGLTFYSVGNASLATQIQFAEKFISEEYEHFYLAVHFRIVAPVLHLAVLILITLLNAAIIAKLYQHSRARSEHLGTAGGAGSQQQRLTLMLMSVSLIALCLRLPFVILHICVIEPFVKRQLHAWWLAFWFMALEFSYSLLYLNSCINFFIYIALSTNFKAQLVHIFCCCRRLAERQRSNGALPPAKSASLVSQTPLPDATEASQVSETPLPNGTKAPHVSESPLPNTTYM